MNRYLRPAAAKALPFARGLATAGRLTPFWQAILSAASACCAKAALMYRLLLSAMRSRKERTARSGRHTKCATLVRGLASPLRERAATDTQPFKEKLMRFASSCWLLALALAVHGPVARAADAFAPVGAKATLSVEYLYESAGKKQDANDLREWRARRTVSMVADLASQSPTALPTMQALDAAQTAKLDKQTEQMGRMAKEMAPLTADVEKLMAKCGDDDKCIEREAMKLGLAMAGTPKADAVLKTGKQTAEVVKPGAPRYQAWRTTAQRGSYTIDETARSVLADPICLPTQRCTRNEVRKGAGALPSNTTVAQGVGAFNAVEVDTAKKTLTIALPVPALPLPYTETITTNEPDGARDTPTPKGPQPRQLVFRTSADGNNKPITVALKGGWRSQSGEQVIQVKGDAGKLTVRWRFEAQ